MNALFTKSLVLMAVLAAVSTGSQSQPAAPAGQAANSPQQPASPPKSAPKKKPEEPVDPDNTAGVRGPGSLHTVRVLSKGKPAQSVHVLVKNTNGSLAASCFTNVSGECKVDLGADNYVIDATKSGLAGNVSQHVDDTTGPIVIKLAKVKTDSSAAKP